MEKEKASLTDSSLSPSGITIIGSGPSGCTAAIICAQAGLNTTLITKNVQPPNGVIDKIKNTALESIDPACNKLITEIFGLAAITAAVRAPYDGIQTGNKYVAIDEEGDWHGYHINRDVLDAQLLNAAAWAGVSIIANESVQELIQENNWVTGVKTFSGKIIPSAYVIDASGHKRLAGKKLKFKEKFFSPPLVSWTGVSTRIIDKEDFFTKGVAQFIPDKNGWTWLAPELPDRCTWTRLAKKGLHDILPPPELSECPLEGKIEVANMRWRIFRPLCKEGLLLCGDAAGILDPAAGQGVRNAILSGKAAAQTVIACLHTPEEESVYLAEYDNWFVQQYEEKAELLRRYYSEHGIDIFNKQV